MHHHLWPSIFLVNEAFCISRGTGFWVCMKSHCFVLQQRRWFLLAFGSWFVMFGLYYQDHAPYGLVIRSFTKLQFSLHQLKIPKGVIFLLSYFCKTEGMLLIFFFLSGDRKFWSITNKMLRRVLKHALRHGIKVLFIILFFLKACKTFSSLK